MQHQSGDSERQQKRRPPGSCLDHPQPPSVRQQHHRQAAHQQQHQRLPLTQRQPPQQIADTGQSAQRQQKQGFDERCGRHEAQTPARQIARLQQHRQRHQQVHAKQDTQDDTKITPVWQRMGCGKVPYTCHFRGGFRLKPLLLRSTL